MKVFFKKLKKCNSLLLTLFILVFLGFIVSLGIFTKSILSLEGIETGIRIVVIAFFYLLWIVYSISALLLLFKRKQIKFSIFTLIMALFIPAFGLGSHYIDITYNKISGLTKEKVTYTSVLITLKDTTLNKDSKLAMISDTNDIEGNILAKKIVDNEKIENTIISYDDYHEMLAALYEQEIAGLFISANYVVTFNDEMYENIENETKIIYSYSEERENEDIATSTNKALTEPFTILLMGVDSVTDGLNANQTFNGDTLMLITFNPKTLNATIFSIPRDTYVPIACRNGIKNKINSSAAYGTKCVIDTIEDLTDIEIDYYVKINFKGVVDLVEALGGIDGVNIPISFCEQDSNRYMTYDKYGRVNGPICLNSGENQSLNGEEALAFARHRKSYAQADIMRVQMQQHLVEQIAKKATSIRSFNDFQNILSAVQKNVDTNMSTSKILSLYNIGKDILVNKLSGNGFITIEKTYMEYYSQPIYSANGSYISAIGYYQSSMDEIIKAMKINLELEEAELIKTFSYSYQEEYEQKIYGKNSRTGTSTSSNPSNSNGTMPSLVGESLTEIDAWCNIKGIECQRQDINEGHSLWNASYPTGTVVGQSVKKGVDLNTVSIVIVYVINNPNYGQISTEPETNTEPTEVEESDNEEELPTEISP